MNGKILSYAHAGLAIALAIFFMYAGSKKFMSSHRPVDIEKQIQLAEKVANNQFESPTTFTLTMKSMKSSGFLYVVGVLQLLAGLLLLFPKTRLIGSGVLLPVTLNIFLLHLFMDNRMSENIETGAILMVNVLVLAFYWRTLRGLVGRMKV